MKYAATINLLLFCFLFSISCQDSKTRSREEFYPSGAIKSEGRYLNDSIPIDTFRYYYPTGELLSITVYDSAGNLNGENRFFYKSGHLRQVQNYKHGVLEGWISDFSDEGKMTAKSFHRLGKRIGDAYFYNQTNGILESYNFYDNLSRNVMLRDFENGRQIRREGNDFIIDSIFSKNDTLLELNKFKCELLIAHAPRTYINVDAVLINCKGNEISMIPIQSGLTWQTLDVFIDSNICEIRIKAEQYDSITQKWDRMMLKHLLK